MECALDLEREGAAWRREFAHTQWIDVAGERSLILLHVADSCMRGAARTEARWVGAKNDAFPTRSADYLLLRDKFARRAHPVHIVLSRRQVGRSPPPPPPTTPTPPPQTAARLLNLSNPYR